MSSFDIKIFKFHHVLIVYVFKISLFHILFIYPYKENGCWDEKFIKFSVVTAKILIILLPLVKPVIQVVLLLL